MATSAASAPTLNPNQFPPPTTPRRPLHTQTPGATRLDEPRSPPKPPTRQHPARPPHPRPRTRPRTAAPASSKPSAIPWTKPATRSARGISQPITIDHLVPLILDRLANRRPHLRPVINATGVLLHTGLGRAPLAPQAIAAVTRLVAGYCNLEFDLETGSRGHRSTPIKTLLNQLTGCQSAAIVNNNAAATILALKALAAGREVIVSRSQLVEIGGSFRLPEIFETSGARLREVGTTNKTRLADYDRAITPDTAALLRVHASNFRIVGFTESVPSSPWPTSPTSDGLLAIDDIGSGALAPGLPTLPRRRTHRLRKPGRWR